MKILFIDGDFPTGKKCKYHCSSSRHPGQVGPKWYYGCTHKAWPQNRNDFCPFVDCDGDPVKCEIPQKFIKYIIRGRQQRIKNAQKKVAKYEAEIMELEYLRTRAGREAAQARKE